MVRAMSVFLQIDALRFSRFSNHSDHHETAHHAETEDMGTANSVPETNVGWLIWQIDEGHMDRMNHISVHALEQEGFEFPTLMMIVVVSMPLCICSASYGLYADRRDASLQGQQL